MKSIFRIFIVAILGVVCLSSCITSKDTNLLQDIDIDYTTIPPPDEYRIIPGDVLQVVVYVFDDVETQELFRAFAPQQVNVQTNDLNTHGGFSGSAGATEEGTGGSAPITVYADGTINFPYLGRIYVKDLTLLEARKLLSNRLKELSENAEANVTLRNNFFSILGEAGSRRVQMQSNNMTIYQALASAGTISDYAQRNRVTVIRQTSDGSRAKTFDLRSKDIMNTDYYYIQPNDVIYFPRSATKFLGGTNNFVGIFGLLTSFGGIIVMAFRLF